MLRSFLFLIGFLFVLVLAGGGSVLYVFYSFGAGLPDYTQLADYEPPVMTRVHAGDGRLLAEYATEKRVFVPVKAMPRRIIQAFLAAEDKNFYYHPGIDPAGIVRATLVNLKNLAKSRRLVGASTITQQVAKNFLLTSEVSLKRKIQEAILAFRIENALDKDRILELYLNEIYLGFGSYGVAAAALNYFNKSLDILEIEEAAFLAALPKAPNNYDPRRHPKAALGRRDWVIERMRIEGYVTPGQAAAAKAKPLIVRKRATTEIFKAEYFAEKVRRELASKYGEDQLYKGGLSVRTTLDPRLQDIADRVLRKGLISYDRRHGWRGAMGQMDMGEDWRERLARFQAPPGMGTWRVAMVLGFATGTGVDIGLADGSLGIIPLRELKWARAQLAGQRRGPRVSIAGDVLSVGDVIAVEPVPFVAEAEPPPLPLYALRQIPEIDGALIALDPHTGRVLAMSGGYDYEKSQFNRAVQARRQPGSAFKPFVYLAALDAGFTPSTLILDAPFVIDQGPGLPKWRPANYTKKFYGPSTMRLGLEKSRNLMTVRLAQTVGMDKITGYARRFGLVERMPNRLSMALGAGETTLLRLTTAYAMLVNGGKKINPTLIDRIQDRHGRTVFRHDRRVCTRCQATFWTGQTVPTVPDTREAVTNPASAYQMVSMLQGVVQRGTGRSLKAIGIPLAGKTGTTNDALDTWFMGFSPDLAIGVFAGFDRPRSLGRREQGATVSAPIFRDFVKEALSGKPAIPFRIPSGIRLVRVNGTTGKPALPGERNIILEAFKPGTVPTGREQIVEGLTQATAGPAPESGTGGLY